MEDKLQFAEILRGFMAKKGVGSQRLSHDAHISKNTIDNWVKKESVKRPRDWTPLVSVARALFLSREDADKLLRSAGHPSIDELVKKLGADELLENLRPTPRSDDDRRYLQLLLPPTITLSLTAKLHQVPAPFKYFVGRDAEIEELQTALLAASHDSGVAVICSIHGMGGIGKTELAYKVMSQLSSHFPDAQIIIDLQGTDATPLRPEQALQTVIRAFSLNENEKLPDNLIVLQQRYRSVLHNRRALILADDADGPEQVHPLRPPPGCVLLITSRRRFSLDVATISLEQLSDEEAIALLRMLCDRLTRAEALSIARGCGHLPLALRVAGGLLHNNPSLAIADYLARLTDTRQRLTQLRDPSDPHLDVEASLALSYALLDVPAQRVFRQLGVMAADFETAMALAVIEAPEGVNIEETLRLLERWNLIIYDLQRERWNRHDLIRDVALHRLEAAGEADAVYWHYVRYVVQLAETLNAQYLTGGDVTRASLIQFDRERRHFDAAWRWATAHAGTLEGDRLVLASISATYCLDTLRDDVEHERIPKLEAALAAAQRLRDAAGEGRTLNRLGIAYRALGQVREAIPYYEHALTILCAIGDGRGEGMVLNNLGLAYQNLGESQRAIAYYTKRLTLAQALGDQRGEGITLGNLGLAYAEGGQPHQAIPYYKRALTLTRVVGDRLSESITLGNLGLAYAEMGEADQASEFCASALACAQAIGSRQQEAYALSALARITAAGTTPEEAFPLFEEASIGFQAVGDRWGEAECMWHWGLALLRQGDCAGALPHLCAAVAYEVEIEHAQATAHMALLRSLQVEAVLSTEQQ